jgi:hypothetical protein
VAGIRREQRTRRLLAFTGCAGLCVLLLAGVAFVVVPIGSHWLDVIWRFWFP